jgi:hypothetical protein
MNQPIKTEKGVVETRYKDANEAYLAGIDLNEYLSTSETAAHSNLLTMKDIE